MEKQHYGIPMFEVNWPVAKELLFLKALNIFGPENWVRVAEILKGTPQQMRDHYQNWYINNRTQEEPERLIPTKQKLLISDKQLLKQKLIAHNQTIQDNKNKKQVINKTSESKFNNQKQQMNDKNKQSINPVFGYNPYTETFDETIYQEAQLLLAYMEVSPDDSPQTKSKRQSIFRYYTQILKKREKIEKLAIKHELLVPIDQRKPSSAINFTSMDDELYKIYKTVMMLDKQGEIKKKFQKYGEILLKIKQLSQKSEKKAKKEPGCDI